jgi:3-hydroxybutyryl-CoA dehydrogenase
MQKIAVIGAGTMGNGIAHVFAQNGFKVSLIDITQESLDRGLATIAKNLGRQVSKGAIEEAVKTSTLANINTETDLKIGLADADLVVEQRTSILN